MLEIDYSLVPMGEADEQFVRQEVLRRVEAGEIPPPDRSVNGRMVLLNPDLVQTVHQIPDDLRPRLRRIMAPAQEGSTHLSAKHLYQRIIESDERLYFIVMELQSEFRALSDFLDYLPKLRARYPELGIFLSGTLPSLRDMLRQVLAAGGSTLVLEYGQGERTVEIASAEDFDRQVTTQEQVVSYAQPFFTDIRLTLDKSGKPIPFNLVTLRKLQSVFGYGDAPEVEVGKGRKERLIIIDLPLPLIRDFRFRQDRGLDFLGVSIGGQTVQSRHFGDEKLEFRWVPMAAVEKFLRRTPAGAQEEIDMRQVGKLRVNTNTGEVSFLMKTAGEKVAVEQARVLGFRKQRKGKAGPSLGGNGAEEPDLFVTFDRYIQPSASSASHDPMQEAVRDHFYHKLIGEEVEHTRKRELYAQRLKAAAVGPLAGQTLKLLRRFGLENLIDADAFHYLCDTPEEVPFYRNTPERYEEHFKNLVGMIREVATNKPSENVRVADIAYNLPISTEWVDAGLAKLEAVSNEELGAVYHEMHLLKDFIAHEFKRNFDIKQEDLSFFAKMDTCRDAGLLAKWLSEYKRGAYGTPMPADARPDMLFFGTEEDKKENDRRTFFPSLACAELVAKPISKSLFKEFDYDFSVFLEDQMALAVHQAREDGVLKPGADDFSKYFASRLEENKKQQAELREMLAAIDDENSPIYRQMLEEEERAYHERYEQFVKDRQRVDEEFKQVSAGVEELVRAVKPQLSFGDMSEADFFHDNPEHPELLEQRVLGAAAHSRERLQEALQASFTGLLEQIRTWRGSLEQFVLALRKLLHNYQAWQAANDARQTAGLREQWQGKVSGYMEQVRRMQPMERDQHSRRVQTQLRNYQGELTQINAKVAEGLQKNQRAAGTLHAYVTSAGGRLDSLSGQQPGEQPEQVVAQAEALRKLLHNIGANAVTLAARAKAMQDELEQVLVRKQRYLQQHYQFRAELALIRAVEDRAEPVLPKVQTPGGKVPDEAAVARLRQAWQVQSEQVASTRAALEAGAPQLTDAIQQLRGKAVEFKRFREQQEQLIKQSARKARLRDSTKSLAERQVVMDAELADLPKRVREQFMPARKQLLVEAFLPESELRATHLAKAQTFITELLSLAHEPLRKKYLDHALFRRFYWRQFVRGGAYAADPNHDLHYPTRNVSPALRLLLRGLVHNFKQNRLVQPDHVQLSTLSNQKPQQILTTIANMAAVQGRGQFDYLVLPPTMHLREGLDLLHKKDALYEGVPRLVLVFITKFDPNLLRRDTELRESYFSALKHNVILNIDGHAVVDNPRSIGMRLLHETLGSAVDVQVVEEPPAVASAAE